MAQPVSYSGFKIPPALRYPAYRWFWIGTLASVGSSQMRMFAIAWYIYYLTEDTLYLAYAGLAGAVPTILLTVVGGVIADKMDRRLLLGIANAFNTSMTILLATLIATDVIEPWHILAYAFIEGFAWAVHGPAHEALYPALVDSSALNSAVALDAATWNATSIISPFLAGFIIAHVGMAACFYITAGGFFVMVIVVFMLPHIKQPKTEGGVRATLDAIMAGLRFIKGRSIFVFLTGLSFSFTYFVMSWTFLMPVFSKDILEIGADGQGNLLMLMGIGALLASIRMSTLEHIQQRGFLVICAGAMTGLLIAAFALTSEFVGSYFLAMGIAFFIGIFETAFINTCISSVQILVPDEFRGRVMAFYTMTWSFISLGGAQHALVAKIIGAPTALAIGGFIFTAIALGPALLSRQVRNLGTLVNQAQPANSPA